MGMVPNLATGVWVGGEDRAVHFKSIAFGQGATMALPIWGVYMKKLYENVALGISVEDFTVPENLSISIECEELNEEGTFVKPKAKANLDALGF
jgi:penicillin-binding protein 1A